MRKNRTNQPRRYSSSKHAASAAGRELTLLLLRLLSEQQLIPKGLFESKKKKSRKLWEMRRLGYITSNADVTIRGKYMLSEEKIWSLTIPYQKHWDGKWRMVLFDIPAKKSKQRESFRLRLKELGLVLYQNSVWICPYPLEKTIRAISDFYMISDCVLFVVAEKLNGENKLMQTFGLKK